MHNRFFGGSSHERGKQIGTYGAYTGFSVCTALKLLGGGFCLSSRFSRRVNIIHAFAMTTALFGITGYGLGRAGQATYDYINKSNDSGHSFRR